MRRAHCLRMLLLAAGGTPSSRAYRAANGVRFAVKSPLVWTCRQAEASVHLQVDLNNGLFALVRVCVLQR